MTAWPEAVELMSRDVTCRYDPDAWFDEHRTQVAKGFCEGCPLRLRCLLLGLGEEYGVWGGMGVRARERLRKAAFPGVVASRAVAFAREVALSYGSDVDLLAMLPSTAASHPQLVGIAKL